jgi:hypothetical protein
MVPDLGSAPLLNASEGLAPLSRWTWFLRASFSRHPSAASREIGGSEGASSLLGS